MTLLKPIASVLLSLIPFYCVLAQHEQSFASSSGLAKPNHLNLTAYNDDPKKEWSYLKNSTTVIGMPFAGGDVTQVTYDGALYTRHAELCFFYGKNNTPLDARQKNFLNGWIPIVQYVWMDCNIKYSLEIFAAGLENNTLDNTINFVRFDIENTGKEKSEYQLSAAIRGRLNDSRFGELIEYDISKQFSMNDSSAWLHDKLLYTFSPPAKLLAINNQAYATAFTGNSVSLTNTTPACIANYKGVLRPKEKTQIVIKFPRVPVLKNAAAFLRQLHLANYDAYKRKTVDYWEKLLNEKTQYQIPEKRVSDALKASMVHLLLATRTDVTGKKTQTDGLPYPNFFLTSAYQMSQAYLENGLNDYSRLIADNAVQQQETDGLYFDRSLAHGGVIPAAHGHVMLIIAKYYLFTKDKEYARTVFSSLAKAVGYIEKSIAEDEYGLLPPTYPYDNEMIEGHYLSTNLWTLMGLRYAIRLAEGIQENNYAQEWRKLETRYRNNILIGLEHSVSSNGYVPTGLYEFLTGEKTSRHFREYQTNNNWENMLLSFPVELLQPHDLRVKMTLQKIRNEYAEGIMTYRHGQHLHQYITSNMIVQYMTQGNAKQALTDFYHLLVHSGSTHEGFENLVVPWKDRLVSAECPSPHAWAAAHTASLIRNFLIYEYGGNNGLDPLQRGLYLFSVLSPEWTKVGKKISIKNAHTEFGKVNAELMFKKTAATLTFDGKLNSAPHFIRIRVPYFKKLMSVKCDAANYKIEDDCIVFSADVKNATIYWKDIPQEHLHTVENLLKSYRSTDSFSGIDEKGHPIIQKQVPFILPREISKKHEPLSFTLVKNTFLYEFKRRANLRSVTKVNY